jgi:glutaredoxin 3|tara:strand:- start:293 stop:544 length:252 start_codon:yes stop_codon:yes gene_type:complete
MIEIYTTRVCPYCDQAKALFKEKGLEYTEYLVDSSSEKMSEMLERSQRRTVPQIFIHGHHVGGFDDLKQLVEANRLDDLLKGA